MFLQVRFQICYYLWAPGEGGWVGGGWGQWIVIYQSEAATRGVLYKNVFLKISQNSQENTCARFSFLIKLQTSACNFIKKRLWHRCFPVKFSEFLRILFLQNTSRRVFLTYSGKAENLWTFDVLYRNHSLSTYAKFSE